MQNYGWIFFLLCACSINQQHSEEEKLSSQQPASVSELNALDALSEEEDRSVQKPAPLYSTIYLDPDTKEYDTVESSLDEIEKTLFEFVGFNYPKLTPTLTEKSLSLANDSIRIGIETAPFDTLAHTFLYTDGFSIY
ncbi:hypothetical protein SAMN05421823_102153 [Catalinimonas alkaloidigena]|uniref:Uncharacterized protein n=1 Tax=Catalinimonas alkaloidigena TaxID=1075417 RepID=A0A1G9A1K3_9BACT|nr:hypothetical protein [Catalinimonas alkaloidigena]SDK21141.1 hypothetical protein SAMN05421823_102153 [Catalinimonas alkaloidigena]